MSTGTLKAGRIAAGAGLLAMLTLVHALVDLFAASVQPLWPDFQQAFQLGDSKVQVAYLSWSLSTSFAQLFFGLWGDRARNRWLIWAGPALGVIGVAGVGISSSLPELLFFLVLGGLGIAAFHPEAAWLAGSSLPGDRSRAMSIFAVGGFLGQAAGPIYSGMLTTRLGLGGLAWSVFWALPLLAVLSLLLRKADAMPRQAGGPQQSLRALLRGRKRALGLILSIAVLRVLPGLGVPLAVAFAMKAVGATNSQIGVVQAAFFGGIGLGSLACAVMLRRRHERFALVAIPLFLAGLLAVTPLFTKAALTACVSVCGLLLGVVSPVLIGYGQRLLPEGQRLASAITMGVSWGIGGLIVSALVGTLNYAGRPLLALPIFGAAVALSSLLCLALPRPEPEIV